MGLPCLVSHARGFVSQALKGFGLGLLLISDVLPMLPSVKESQNKESNRVIIEKLILPSSVLEEMAKGVAAPNPAVHAAVVGEPGVRIGVRKDGLYRVTKNELEKSGFNVSGNSDLWQLYLNGVEQALHIGPKADYIEFYGKGFDSAETDLRVYYLVSGKSAGKRIKTMVERPPSSRMIAKNYVQTLIVRDRLHYFDKVMNGDSENYWGRPITSFDHSKFNFRLSGVDLRTSEATIELAFQGRTWEQHNVGIQLNGKPLGTATGHARDSYSKTFAVPTNFLQEGVNTLVFRSPGPSSDQSLFDAVRVTFRRKYIANENRLSFFAEKNQMTRLAGFSSQDVRVFDMTADGTPVLIGGPRATKSGKTFGVIVAAADRGRVMFAVSDAGVLSPASITPNDPTMLAQKSNAAELVIIAHKNFLTQAEDWANYRREQGVTVKVVEVSEIFDEFTYGVFDSNAIKTFLRYARENWRIPPAYILLVGDASYDSRNYEGHGYNNLVPTKIVPTDLMETGSDSALGDFNDDGISEMAIGRIPARDSKAVTVALAKVKAWERTIPAIEERGVLFAHDKNDERARYDFPAISQRLRKHIDESVDATLIGHGEPVILSETPQDRLVSSINKGKFLVSYIGHGTTGAWVNSLFFSIKNIPGLTNADNPSIFTMFACLNGYFLHVSNKSLAESLLEAPNGGAVAVWASAGEPVLEHQEEMAARFLQRINSGSIERLGDIVRDAKSAIPKDTDIRRSWVLLGDPMLKVRSPDSRSHVVQ